jgi:hypothetical protein
MQMVGVETAGFLDGILGGDIRVVETPNNEIAVTIGARSAGGVPAGLKPVKGLLPPQAPSLTP